VQRWERIDHREFFNGENSACQRSKMKDDARETYIRAKQKAQHQVKIVLDQLHTNYGFRQYEIMPQESPEQYGPGTAHWRRGNRERSNP
jgi:hypothetical protein